MPVPLALFWHQHQPYYKDLSAGEMAMPWVRLHGLKDYYGMARLIEHFPGMRCTINLVPSLVAQLLDYVQNGATDPFLRRTRTPADGLSGEDVHFILDHFYMAQWDRMIRVHPRYRELLDRRRFGRRPASNAANDFSVQDLRDLQVWFNLVWFHPVCFEEYETLRALRQKGANYTEHDKQELMKVHDQVLARVVPLHKELQDRGQLELTTTPFYHPIMPLLIDMRCAQVAMPRTPMPNGYKPLSEDAEYQLERAVKYHEQIFGRKPDGLWPSEGSVCPELIPLAARLGINWLATDEEILSASLGAGLRGSFGKLEAPQHLYRAWRLEAHGASLNGIFRDHQFSDLIGFQYQSWDGEAAANDLISRVEAAARGHPAGQETLISIILDGENCWEHYPEQGLKFLRTLYGRLQDNAKGVTPVRVGDFLRAHPPTHRIDRLFPGSWINHDFYIWIGHTDDRKAWEYVFRVREDLVRETEKRGRPLPFRAQENDPNPELVQAWEELAIAEGSDWCWWYGDDHTSGNDDAFDQLFRKHLKNVYAFLKLPVPYFLDQPVPGRRAPHFTTPSASLRVTLDGRVTNYFEWLGAGMYRTAQDVGTMHAATAPLISQVLFGHDNGCLCVRIDPDEQSGALNGGLLRRVALLFTEPRGAALVIEKGPPVTVRGEGYWPGSAQTAQVVWDEVVEVRVPFAVLGLQPGQDVSFFVDAGAAGGDLQRLPRAGALQFSVPGSDTDERDWIA